MTRMRERQALLTSPNSKLVSEDFPVRPTFGDSGRQVTLWANYFGLKTTACILSRYTLTIDRQGDSTEEGKAEDAPPRKYEAKGRKLQIIIQKALTKLNPSTPFASEYKSQVISLQDLDLPSDGTVQVELDEPGMHRAELWNVNFGQPSKIRLDQMLGYLSTSIDLEGDSKFPKFPDEIGALGVILGHQARNDSGTIAVGSNRFFATDEVRNESARMPPNSGLEILRGYSQSVRLATGRLLLNANVTHGVFRQSGDVVDLCRMLGADKMNMIDSMSRQEQLRFNQILKRLSEILSRARIQCQVLSSGNEPGYIAERSTAGLACITDASNSKEMSPKFSVQSLSFGGPTLVHIFLRQIDSHDEAKLGGLRYNEFCTVAEYYRARESRHPPVLHTDC
jgi:hypothetical protein